jgi:hypothetical protein
MILPQEIQVRYIIPALRKAFADSLVNDYGLTQARAADILDVTPAAISQYFTKKRAASLDLPNVVRDDVRAACDRILDDETSLLHELHRLTTTTDVKELMCTIHRDKGSVTDDCRICFE